MAVPKKRVSHTKKRLKFAGSKRKKFDAQFAFCSLCKNFRNYRIKRCSCKDIKNKIKNIKNVKQKITSNIQTKK